MLVNEMKFYLDMTSIVSKRKKINSKFVNTTIQLKYCSSWSINQPLKRDLGQKSKTILLGYVCRKGRYYKIYYTSYIHCSVGKSKLPFCKSYLM